jgi:hypothetical protein
MPDNPFNELDENPFVVLYEDEGMDLARRIVAAAKPRDRREMREAASTLIRLIDAEETKSHA